MQKSPRRPGPAPESGSRPRADRPTPGTSSGAPVESTGLRLSIDWVSPLPPVRSGIADYSLDLLPHLERLCDLRIVRLADSPIGEEVAARWRPVSAAEIGVQGRLPVYQMGNNRYHEEVLRWALERPGVVVLHDLVLHHLLVESTLGKAELEPYLETLTADHGWVGELAAKARRWGELGQAALFGLGARRSLLRRQRGVLVHSAWAVEHLREDDPDLTVLAVPMAVPLPEPPEREAGAAFRQRLGVPGGAPLLGCFGFQTPIKRTDRVISALTRPELRRAHLVVVGEVSEVFDLEGAAAGQGVADRVHFLGFVGYEEFLAAIAACDLCINLRYPTAGETSASLLRILAMGRPALVSDFAQFSELPDEVAVKVPLGSREVEELAARAGSVLADRSRLEGMSIACREYVRREHDPDRAARRIVAACAELAQREPPGAEPPEVSPPTSLVWRRLDGDLEIDGVEAPWPEGEARDIRVRLANHSDARWLATARGRGGLMLDVHWRRSPWHPPTARQWIELTDDLAPGAALDLGVRLRRPPGSLMLVVEPHLSGIAGFNLLGGPVWTGIIRKAS